MAVPAVDLGVAEGLDYWAEHCAEPSAVVIDHGHTTYRPADVAAAYRAGDEAIVRIVDEILDHVGDIAVAFS